MTKKHLGLFLALVAPSVLAQSGVDSIPQAYQSLTEKINQTFERSGQTQLHVVGIRETPLAGILELEVSSGEMLLSDINGDYLITGDLIQTGEEGMTNLSAEGRKRSVQQQLAAVPQSDMIVFTPERTLATIHVFTDTDCTFCRKLHVDMPLILESGIEVRYLAYPRGGAEAPSYQELVSVWCAPDKKTALGLAKSGLTVPAAECNHPVMTQFELGNRLGISGTPLIVLADGSLAPGYLNAQRLQEIVLGLPPSPAFSE